MNVLKVVIDGGWIIRETEMEQILSLIEMTEDVRGMSLIVASNDKEVKKIARDGVEFFKIAMREFGCSLQLIRFVETSKKELLRSSAHQ